MGANTGETLQERSKGKDVRTSNIVAAKVRSLGSGDRYLWYSCIAVSRLGEWTHCPQLALKFLAGRTGDRCCLDESWPGGWDRRPPPLPLRYCPLLPIGLLIGIFGSVSNFCIFVFYSTITFK